MVAQTRSTLGALSYQSLALAFPVYNTSEALKDKTSIISIISINHSINQFSTINPHQHFNHEL